MFTKAEEVLNLINSSQWMGDKKGLFNERALLELLGNPEQKIKLVHVAGTNGKGSVAATIAKVLEKSGKKVGLNTSPYIVSFNERIRVNGVPISDNELVYVGNIVFEACEKLLNKGIRPTTFELITAMALKHFELARVDYAVIEVGLGGRFDSTNVITPLLSVITKIGLDHMKVLGNTVEEIAFEKAGIIKPGVPVVAMSQKESVCRVFEKSAVENNSKIYFTNELAPKNTVFFEGGVEFTLGESKYKYNLPGEHQLENVLTAILACKKLNIQEKYIIEGVSATKWPVRLEWVGNVLMDGAHNPQGARALKSYCDRFLKDRKKVVIVAMMKDKQIDESMKIIESFSNVVIATKVNWVRAEDEKQLSTRFKNALCAENTKEALEKAKEIAGENGVIITAGSLYLAGEIKRLVSPDDEGVI